MALSTNRSGWLDRGLRKAWPCRQIRSGKPRKAWPCRQIALTGSIDLLEKHGPVDKTALAGLGKHGPVDKSPWLARSACSKSMALSTKPPCLLDLAARIAPCAPCLFVLAFRIAPARPACSFWLPESPLRALPARPACSIWLPESPLRALPKRFVSPNRPCAPSLLD